MQRVNQSQHDGPFQTLRKILVHLFRAGQTLDAREPGPEDIKLEFILKLKIKRNEWLLADTCVRKQPIVVLYFEFETVLKFYNLEARSAIMALSVSSASNVGCKNSNAHQTRFYHGSKQYEPRSDCNIDY